MICVYYWYYDNYYQAYFSEYDLTKAKRFIAMVITKHNYRLETYSCDSSDINEILSCYVTALKKKYFRR